MAINDAHQISYTLITCAVLGAIVIGALLAVMRARHRYQPQLIGALIGALLCFVLLEMLPAIT